MRVGEGVPETAETAPPPTIEAIARDLGSTMLTFVLTPCGVDPVVKGTAIYEPADELMVAEDGLLLGIGVTDTEQIVALLRELGAVRAAGLLVKVAMVDDPVRAAVEATGVALLGVSRAASWVQLVTLLRSMSENRAVAPGGDLAGFPAGDLFSLANAAAALLDSPVTIEDRSSRVLAFSGGQDQADEGRIATVLGRQVPEHWQRRLTEQGVFERLYRSERPIYVEPGNGSLPRAAVCVRAGEEVLGSMWAAIREPLTRVREQAFVDASKVVALHILAQRAGADMSRRLRVELLTNLLEGGPGVAETARRLGLSDRSVCVLALAIATAPEADNARPMAEQQRLADALVLHLSGTQHGGAAAPLGDTVYGVVPVPARDVTGDTAARIAEAFVSRAGGGAQIRVGVGRVVSAPELIGASRADADAVLRVMRETGRGGPVLRHDEVAVDVLLLRMRDLGSADDQTRSGPLARLLEYDAEHHSELVHTVAAYLDCFGDVPSAAQAVHVHANTFRYRLRRVREIGRIELSDPDSRLNLTIQIRLHGLGSQAR